MVRVIQETRLVVRYVGLQRTYATQLRWSFTASLTIEHDVTFRKFSDYLSLVESVICRLGPFALAAICVPPWIDARVALGREEKDAKCFADSGMRSTNGYLQRSQGVRRIAGALVGTPGVDTSASLGHHFIRIHCLRAVSLQYSPGFKHTPDGRIGPCERSAFTTDTQWSPVLNIFTSHCGH
ncbi:hypothetical protein BC629DRAFT_1187268 [Irpex lacteus]|nr:hypothetical protein BC629DRAFT_1187268 [Irpex lacteus]